MSAVINGEVMITTGSIERQEAAQTFEFLSKQYRGRRKAIKAFTHMAPDYVFWIYPDGTLFDAKDAHRKNVPPGHEDILNDEPEYGGFLRGRVASNFGPQIVVVYCEPMALATNRIKMAQLLNGLSQLPIPLSELALVISDNGDLYGTLKDVGERRLSQPE